MFIATCRCPKGILGLGGKASKNKLKGTRSIFPTTNVTILGVFRTHAQKEYGKVWEMKSFILSLTFKHFYFCRTSNALTQSLVETVPSIKT